MTDNTSGRPNPPFLIIAPNEEPIMNSKIEIKINDDGPGIPDDIIKKIGEPYIKSKSIELNSNSGLGLGTFLGKTLLERQGATLSFRRNNDLGGALVIIRWDPQKLINS